MSSSSDRTEIKQTGQAFFAPTRWSVVLGAQDESFPQINEALETLCRTYWYPLYAYVRRQGKNPHEAEDLTQAFFERVIQKNYLEQVRREKGKFRSFLLASMNHFLADERDRAQCQKRGGDCITISFEVRNAEDRYLLEPVDLLDPERLYQRRWAMTVLNQAMTRLQNEFVPAKIQLWTTLQGFLVGDKEGITYSEAGKKLGMS